MSRLDIRKLTGSMETAMFLRRRQLQYTARPDRPDPIFAKMLQDPPDGQWG